MLFGTRKKQNILLEKQAQLNAYVTQYDSAVSLVTNTVDKLGQISQNIEATICEIDDYQKSLEHTKANLNAAKNKNDRVVANFRALLGED